MKIDVKESSMVSPAEPTPRTCLWVSNLDAVYPPRHYVPTCYLYGSNGAHNFFDSTVLKEALGRALVQFYPMAGRLKMDDKNRIEIDCNGKGALFMEAETDGVMADLGDFDNTNLGICFTPVVDFSQGISACPVVQVQVTRFKCGGVCLGFAISHCLGDGITGVRFINLWSDMARGQFCKDDIIPPFFDRRAVLSARDPPQPKFAHIEYQTPPKMNISPHNDAAASTTLIMKKLRLTREQMNALKAKCREEEGIQNTRYSTFEVLAGHVWRCAAITWQLPKDQETKLRIAVDGRARLQQPDLPQGYVGNAVFHATPLVLAGELCSNPIKFAVNRVHEAIARLDNQYLRSAIDYLELQPDFTSISSNLFDYNCPNIAIISWARIPFYDADFGWGRPIYFGRAGSPPSARGHVLPTNDGSMLFGISFPKQQMEHFEKLYYDI